MAPVVREENGSHIAILDDLRTKLNNTIPSANFVLDSIASNILVLSSLLTTTLSTITSIVSYLRTKGYARVRVNGTVHDLSDEIKLEKNKKDTIEVIVDRVVVNKEDRTRI